MSTDSSQPHFSFQHLADQLSYILGGSGIDSGHIDPQDLLDPMKEYKSVFAEWSSHISTWSKDGEPYVRNLVHEGNGKYNLLILVWKPGSGSRIHDHTKHCCMKILKGTLRETLFSWPDEELLQNGELSPPLAKRVTVMKQNDVAYISNSIGLHSMWNPDAHEFAVSLHLYTPPVEACRIFDCETGESSACKL